MCGWAESGIGSQVDRFQSNCGSDIRIKTWLISYWFYINYKFTTNSNQSTSRRKRSNISYVNLRGNCFFRMENLSVNLALTPSCISEQSSCSMSPVRRNHSRDVNQINARLHYDAALNHSYKKLYEIRLHIPPRLAYALQTTQLLMTYTVSKSKIAFRFNGQQGALWTR